MFTPDLPSLLKPLESEISAKVVDGLKLDQSPLPFEDIPSPTICKLWDKYWRYVPLFGTQFFRSLLINGLTHGKVILKIYRGIILIFL